MINFVSIILMNDVLYVVVVVILSCFIHLYLILTAYFFSLLHDRFDSFFCLSLPTKHHII